MKKKAVLGLFIGEATGIGPEITAKVLANNHFDNIQIIIIGDQHVFQQGIDIADTNIRYKVFNEIKNINFEEETFAFYQIDGLKPNDYQLATINKKSGAYTGKVLKTTIDLAQKGIIDGIVYAPINKEALNIGGINFQDEIRYFADLLKWPGIFGEMNYFNGLWLARVTSHIGLRDVHKNITAESVNNAIQLANNTVRKTGIKTPKIAVAALNPHAGEGGLFGDEEISIISPAVKKAKKEGLNISGPYPADTLFIKFLDGQFDVVVSMYHDQGQIAMKLMGFEKGVTVSGGMPIPIATPCHGTAFDLVGKGSADANPIKETIDLIERMLQSKKTG